MVTLDTQESVLPNLSSKRSITGTVVPASAQVKELGVIVSFSNKQEVSLLSFKSSNATPSIPVLSKPKETLVLHFASSELESQV